MMVRKVGRGCGPLLRSTVSVLALAAMGAGGVQTARAADAGAPAPAADSSEPQEVVVVGVRKALENALDVKRESATVVDSISATDIGAFPDESVSGALQRVPGITVNRLQSNDDSTHPSGEPTGVLIRGLPQVRTEFNGRDSFSADASRGLNFNDVSPELMSGVDAYKNQTADMIEGGIAGTVNLRTRLPFDQDGLLVSGNLKADYGDLSKTWTGEFSGIISDTFQLANGRIGIMGNYAHSHVVTQTESVIMDKVDTYCSAGAVGSNGKAIVNADGSIPCTANPFGGKGWAFMPDGVRYSMVDYDRTRDGASVAAQYENDKGNVRATFQFNDSKYHNAWNELASHVIFDGNAYGTPAFNPRSTTIEGPATGTSPFAFGSNGMLTSGILTQAHGSWAGSYGSLQQAINTGSAVPGLPFVNYCGAGATCSTLQDGNYFQDEARNFDHKEDTQDFSLNLKWDVTDRLHTSYDVQRVNASTTNDDMLVTTGSMANFQYSTNGDGTPQVNLLPGSNVNYAAGGLTNPHNYWLPFIQAHLENNTAHETAGRADAEYDIDALGGWLHSVKAGVRVADRDQTVQYSTYNWTPVAASWNCNGPGFNIDNTTPAAYPAGCGAGGTFKGYGANLFSAQSLGSNFYGSGTYNNGGLVFLNHDALLNRGTVTQGLGGAATNSPIAPGWSPICDRSGLEPGTCYLPSEIMHVQENTYAGYAMLNFGDRDTKIFDGVTVQGNAGVRVIRTTIGSDGSVGFPTNNELTTLLQTPCGGALPPGAVVNPSCSINSTLLSFADGSGIPNAYSSQYTDVLPSFNVRFGLPDEQYIRFAASEGLSRPDFGLLRNFVSIQSPVIDTTAGSPYIVRNSAGQITGYQYQFTAQAGNAALKPLTADQFDLGYERYFGKSGLISLDGFYKRLHNTISYGQYERAFTNAAGATEDVLVRGPNNTENGGSLFGFEFSAQAFADFLPGVWSGLGAQVNWTHVEQVGIHNSNLVTEGALDAGGTAAYGAGVEQGGVVLDSHKLAGISNDSYNIVGLYEYGPVAVRLAYNWRSQFLTDNLDCCIGLPVFQKASGFLDGSIRYSINDYIELSLSGSNLLGTTLVYQQQIFGDSTATPGAKAVYQDTNWSRTDRRYEFGTRFKF